MTKKLGHSFYQQPTLKVATSLLGKYLIRQLPSGRKLVAKIIETEAYYGFNDKASHASRGKTKRNEVMFGPPGCAYIYLIYGMHWCFNIITEKEGYPAAVLIRGVEIVENQKSKIKK